MLDPRSRQLLMASLRPPDGYRFDCAIGTTYSLDLIALLTTPLAFAMFDWQRDDATDTADPATSGIDPLALLESLRRCADRIHLFCQAGGINVPTGSQQLLMYLEQMVIEVHAPAVKQQPKRVFHPKVWIIRYIDDSGSVHYRLLCLSRNLTFDRSWDTVLVLEGQLTNRQNTFAMNRPLVDFVAALPGMAIRSGAVNKQASKDIKLLQDELRVVLWEFPADVDEIRFIALGLNAKRQPWPFPDKIDRLLVMSPFVTDGFLEKINSDRRQQFLISRAETLQPLKPEVLQHWSCYTLDDALEPSQDVDSPDELSGQHELSGLHAKVFVADDGWKAHIFTGSANASTAAFDGNVEFLVQLTGKKSKLGVNTFLGEDKDAANLRALLVDFVPLPDAIILDEIQKQVEKLLEDTRLVISALPLSIRISDGGGGSQSHNSVIACAAPVSVAEGVTVTCRPVMLTASDARDVPSDTSFELTFGPHAPESISSFVAFEASATLGNVRLNSSFVLNLPLIGAPSDRRERLLRSMMKDTKTLLRFLTLLLSDDPESLIEGFLQHANTAKNATGHNSDEPLPLLEQMLWALQNSPEKLQQVNRLIEELSADPESRDILPSGLQAVLAPIQRVAASLKKPQSPRGGLQ